MPVVKSDHLSHVLSVKSVAHSLNSLVRYEVAPGKNNTSDKRLNKILVPAHQPVNHRMRFEVVALIVLCKVHNSPKKEKWNKINLGWIFRKQT